MFYFTGDLHGSTDIRKLNTDNFPKQKELSRKDYLFIAGDFGLIWYNSKSKFFAQDEHHLNWLNNKNFTTLVVLGNHENYDIINAMPKKPMFGGMVKQVKENIFILLNGEIYEIDNKKIFVFGGAMSIDKQNRMEHISWWKDEIPSYQTQNYALENLKKVNNRVDIIISHATHDKMFNALKLYDLGIKEKDPLIPFLSEIQKSTQYDFWVNGHYHIEKADADSKTISLYNSIVDYEFLMKRFNYDF